VHRLKKQVNDAQELTGKHQRFRSTTR